MTFDENIAALRQALWMIFLTAGPVLGVALAVGLAVGILQAATSVNESTVGFVPKLAVVLLALSLTSAFMLRELSDYLRQVFQLAAAIR